VLARSRGELGAGLLGADVMARGEHGTLAGEDDDADGVVGLGAGEGIVEFDQHAAVLRVALLRSVQRDSDDLAVVERLPLQELVIGHGLLQDSSGAAMVLSISEKVCSHRSGWSTRKGVDDGLPT